MAQPQRDYLQAYLLDFTKVLNSPDFVHPDNGYARYLDLDSWIDYHLLNILAFNVDALGKSAYFQKQRDGKLVFGPIWDFDRALGSYDGRDANPRSWVSSGPIPSANVFHAFWWGRLFRDPDFWQRYLDRWQALRDAQFSTNHLFHLIDQLADQVRPAQPREFNR